jgi:hypothetical protein
MTPAGQEYSIAPPDSSSRMQAAAVETERIIDSARGRRAYLAGFIAGLTEYAWWKDGEQLVGTCGTTLKTAIERARLDAAQPQGEST